MPYYEHLLESLIASNASAAQDAQALLGSRDIFGRLRTSDPETLFDSTHHMDKAPLLYEETVAGGAESTHLPNEACVRMRVSSAGDSVIRQSRQYIRYQPGTLTNADFAATASTLDADVAATAIEGGQTIQSGYVVAGSGSTRNSVRNGITSKLPLALDASGANPINLSVVVTSMSATASVAAALNWRSLR